MRKLVLRYCCFSLAVVVILSACAVPPPPVTDLQFNDAKTAALDAEKQASALDAEITALENELQEKEAELLKLKEYEQQLKNEGFLEED